MTKLLVEHKTSSHFFAATTINTTLPIVHPTHLKMIEVRAQILSEFSNLSSLRKKSMRAWFWYRRSDCWVTMSKWRSFHIQLQDRDESETYCSRSSSNTICEVNGINVPQFNKNQSINKCWSIFYHFNCCESKSNKFFKQKESLNVPLNETQ